MTDSVDVVVIGGGAAGLSAAVALGRSRRSVIVVDGGAPRNAPAAGVHNLLAREGVAPLHLLALGRAEAATYGVAFVDDAAIAARPVAAGFAVDLAGGRTLSARRIVLATGATDTLPDVPGLAARWGRDVLHCPYCHGWEVRDRRVGVLATGVGAVHQAQLFRQLTESVTVFANGVVFAEGDVDGLTARGIRVVEGDVAAVVVADDALAGVQLAAGDVHPVEALVVSTRLTPRLVPGLGLELAELPAGMGSFVPTELAGATAIPGVWAAGNVSDPMAQVSVAAGQGLMAGARVNADLIAEEVAAAIARPAAVDSLPEWAGKTVASSTPVDAEERPGSAEQDGG